MRTTPHISCPVPQVSLLARDESCSRGGSCDVRLVVCRRSCRVGTSRQGWVRPMRSHVAHLTTYHSVPDPLPSCGRRHAPGRARALRQGSPPQAGNTAVRDPRACPRAAARRMCARPVPFLYLDVLRCWFLRNPRARCARGNLHSYTSLANQWEGNGAKKNHKTTLLQRIPSLTPQPALAAGDGRTLEINPGRRTSAQAAFVGIPGGVKGISSPGLVCLFTLFYGCRPIS